MKKILKIFLAFNMILAIITLLSYLSPIANPKYLWPISVIAVFYPWLLLSNILFIVFWMVYKLRYALISIFTIGLGFVFLNGFIGTSSAGFQSNPNQIEVVSYNTQNLSYIYKNNNNRDSNIQEFFEFLNENVKADIFCTQEMGIRSLELWNRKTTFPHVFAPENIGPAIFSKHPIVKTGQIHSSTSTVNSCVWADVKVGANSYRIYNLHMQSNKITRTAEKVIGQANLQNRETWSGIKSIVKRYKDNAAYRIEHAERIRNHMLESPYPIILAGDFNDVPQSFLYRTLSRDLKDSFADKGRGLGITFGGEIPALRIDYILTDKNFDILQHSIIRSDFSDHYPIKSIIKLKEQP